MRRLLPGVLATLAAWQAHAQAVNPSDRAAQRSAPELEEVIVTARRRDENLQETPVSVTAFSADDLARRSLGSLTDIAPFTPNLRRSAGPQGGSSGHYFIRGVGQLDFLASTDPGVGVYLDGVYLGRTTGATFDLLDIDRVEVLRGPQGTLFGRNTIGGAVSVVSAAPPAEHRGTMTITFGERSRRDARVAFGGRLGSGHVSGDVAVLAKSQDGWQHRLVDDTRFGDERTYATRGVLDWRPSDSLDVRATVDATHSRGTADPHYLAAADAARGGRSEFVVTDPATTWSGQASRDDLDTRGMAVTLTYDLPRLTLKSTAGYRQLDSSTGIDFDGSPFPDLDQTVITDQAQASEELQLSGSQGNGKLTWLAGAFLFREAVEQHVPIVIYGSALSQNNALDNRSAALFAHVSYAFNDRLGISGGLRANDETKEHAFDHYFVLTTGVSPLFPPTTLHDRWRSVTPKLGVEYQVKPALLFYSSVSQGFRSGGFNGRPFGTDEFLSYAPETLTTLESGFKSEWRERRIRLNAAAFVSRYEDIQLSRTAIASSGTPIVVTGNAGEARVYGLEVELEAAATERLLLTASLGHIHDEYTRVEPGAAVNLTSELPVAPDWTVSTAVEYTAPLPAGRLRVRVDYSYTGRYNYFFENPELSWEAPHRLWNVRVGFEPNNRLEFAAFVLNAANERYSVFREDVRETFGVAIVWPAPPREWGVEMRYRF